MKTHTSNFKNQLIEFGRDFNDLVTYNGTTLSNEDLKSFNISYKSSLMKSVMKELKIDTTLNLTRGGIINYQLGLKVGNSYEYLPFGNFIVEKIEEQKDKRSNLVTCYDKMLLTMVDYEDLQLTYPITVRSYLSAICDHFGITFANENDTFINYDKEISKDYYLDEGGNSIGYTFRDVLDDIAQVTGSFIIINNDDELELKYITQTNDTINEEYFNDVNVNIGKKYGPINALVFSRTGEDNIYRKDDESVEDNGLCEIKITDNQLLSDNDRENYIDDLFDYLDGISYYLNDYDSKGILYYEVGDMYNVSIFNNTYNCLMLNDEINRSPGVKETIYTEQPETSETDYKKADKTDRKVNQTLLIVDKQEGTITGLVSKTDTIEMTATEASNLANQASNTAIEANTKANNIDEDLQEYKRTVSTQFTQTSEDFTFQFNNITDLINQVSDTENAHYSELHNYIRFVSTPSGPVIVLGQEGSQLTAELSNDKLSFKENGTEVAYVSNNKLNITNADIRTQLDLGNFQFKPRDNGSLSFGKKN